MRTEFKLGLRFFNNDSFCTASESQRGSLSGPVGDSAVHGVCFESIERLFDFTVVACMCLPSYEEAASF